jgi:hypothetical protein
VKIWEIAGRHARLRMDLPHNIAGRGHGARGIADLGNRLRQLASGPCNSPATPRAAVASFLFQRAPDAAAERPRDGSAPAPPPTLTHMSLEADAHVMTRPPGHLTLTHMSYSTPGNRPDADRHSGRMLR